VELEKGVQGKMGKFSGAHPVTMHIEKGVQGKWATSAELTHSSCTLEVEKCEQGKMGKFSSILHIGGRERCAWEMGKFSGTHPSILHIGGRERCARQMGNFSGTHPSILHIGGRERCARQGKFEDDEEARVNRMEKGESEADDSPSCFRTVTRPLRIIR